MEVEIKVEVLLVNTHPVCKSDSVSPGLYLIRMNFLNRIESFKDGTRFCSPFKTEVQEVDNDGQEPHLNN